MSIDWNGIVCEHGPAVFGAAWRILGRAADAEDVVQEVFLEAQQLENSHTVNHWAGLLRRMATFRALDRLRRRKDDCSLDNVSVADSNPGPEEVAIGHELEHRLRTAIGQLARQEAAVFCLRYYEDFKYEQIAESLSITTAAVATALRKARLKLKTLLDDSEKMD